jgi:hypothetical protein
MPGIDPHLLLAAGLISWNVIVDICLLDNANLPSTPRRGMLMKNVGALIVWGIIMKAHTILTPNITLFVATLIEANTDVLMVFLWKPASNHIMSIDTTFIRLKPFLHHLLVVGNLSLGIERSIPMTEVITVHMRD